MNNHHTCSIIYEDKNKKYYYYDDTMNNGYLSLLKTSFEDDIVEIKKNHFYIIMFKKI